MIDGLFSFSIITVQEMMSNKLTIAVKAAEQWSNKIKRALSLQRNRRTPRIGVALSSGGAKGLGHIGVLEVLEEHNIPIDIIAGSSMGAYIGALWAVGVDTKTMRRLAEDMQGDTIRKLADPAIPPTKGAFYGNKVKEHLMETIHNLQFEDAQHPLLITACNLDTYERKVFHQGTIADAVHASCAMPGVIVPVEINGHRYTDGGVIEPVPVGSLRKYAKTDYIIAVTTIPSLEDIATQERAILTAKQDYKETRPWWKSTMNKVNNHLNPTAEGNFVNTLTRSLRASQIRLADDACQRADTVIRMGCAATTWHEYHRFDEFIQLGRDAATAALPQLLKLLEPISHDSTTQKYMVGERVTCRNL